MENVDVLVGNEEDMQLGLGVQGPQVAGASKLDPAAFIGMIDQVVRLYPNVKVVATTLREVHSTNRHSWSAVAWIDGRSYVAPACELDVYDRVGGGDGQVNRGRKRSIWAGHMGRSLRLSPAIPPWQLWSR